MKNLVLQSLSMRNFRGEKDRTTSFNEDMTTISGANGLGKSRHFDAFIWLLFGKDVQDRKDFYVKTNGLSRVDCEVEGVMNINGETITLRRVYKEKWVKPRGQTEEVFSGHETELYWNGVPLKVGEYQGRINSIIGDHVFKMITNPRFFANMNWQDQRAQLFQIAGTITDAEIASQKPEYRALMDKIAGTSLAEFKRGVQARKHKLKDELEQIQPRIDQTQKLMPEAADFTALEVEVQTLRTQLFDLDKSIADKSEAANQQYKAIEEKQRKIHELKQKQQKILYDAQTAANEAAHKANASRREIERDIETARGDIIRTEHIEALENAQNETIERRRKIEQQVADKRAEWSAENNKGYKGDGICSCCGQLLPEEARTNAWQLFTQAKATKLAEIKQKGVELNQVIENLYKDIQDMDLEISAAKETQTQQSAALDALKQQLAQIPSTPPAPVIPENLPEYTKAADEIKALESEISKGITPVDTAELQANKKEASELLDTAKATLSNKDLIIKYEAEIKELEARGKAIAQQIADAEQEEFVIQNFTKAKIDECSKRINGLFSFVKFQLFEYTIDGNEVETCIPLVNGVPFYVANTAGQVNAGLDIINTLVKYHDVSAPIFIDGRESVNELIPTASQIINLVVTTETQLTIK